MRVCPLAKLSVVAVLLLAGCNSSTTPEAKRGAAKGPNGPDGTVVHFLEAIRTGSQDSMFAMLTEDARDALKSQGMSPQMLSAENASFEVGEVEFVDRGAHVASRWTQSFDDGTQETTEVLWILRDQSSGWRVAGMAWKVFEDLPVIINFEDADDMLRKQSMIEREIAKREQAAVGAEARRVGSGPSAR